MKVIIQMPCLNEEDSLPVSVGALPRVLEGVDEVEWLIINDGSRDGTVEAAKALGVDYIISHIRNLGLAQAFLSGMNAAVAFGADIIVNTDADNQYNAEDIQKLIDPILAGEAEYVIGTRPVDEVEHWSPVKKSLQHFGSWVVRQASHTDVEDAPSGFRAITRFAAMRLHVFNEYTYTLETVIQAGRMKIPTLSIPIRTNGYLRESRLMKSMRSYVQRSLMTIIRSYMTYEPLKFFLIPGAAFFLTAAALGVRYLVFYFAGEGAGHIQSLLLAIMLAVIGAATFIIGFLADLIRVNRQLLEHLDFRTQQLQLDMKQQINGKQPIYNHAYLVYKKKA
ncbi:MAG: glycosyltransferase family 2 protein [Anaerolineae bacterium]|jgi:glycosyltransferase involved in cell wall biosynthesis|nr:glycosyltransferase family 2 protein [Anaerolineae bacterium]